MADTSPETKVKDVPATPANPPLETGTWTPGSSTAGDTKPAVVPGVVPKDFPQNVGISGMEAGAPGAGPGKAATAPSEWTNFDAAKEAAALNDALHPPFFSWRIGPDADAVWNKMLNMSPQEFKAVNDEFTKTFGQSDRPWFSGDKPWTLKDDIGSVLGSSAADRFNRLIEAKGHNDVPPEHRVSGEQLLKPGSNLKVGEINAVTLPDGRRYDVYVPKNADDRGPVIVAMHGAAGGDSVGLIAQETGMTADAERTGSMVIFAYPEKLKYDSKFGQVDGVAWHAPGHENLPRQVNAASDDYKYLDNAIDDLGAKAHTTPKVGIFGFSDGGRFGGDYAADRPNRVAALVSEDGTVIYGDKKPTQGLPVMIVHGDADETLPYNGGMGSMGGKMDWLLGTTLDRSAPYMQAQNWKAADQCDGPLEVHTQGDVTTRDYTGCKVGEVKEYILKDGHHAINDYKNNGNRFMQWLLGSPDRRQDFVTQGATFLNRYIVSDPSMSRPG